MTPRARGNGGGGGWRSGVRSSLLYLVTAVAGFALAYLVVAFVVFPAGVIPRDVKVPNVMGLMYEEAEQRLAQAGFTAERGEQRYNNSAPTNTVLEQSPPPGVREGIGAPVTLVVSGGQRLVSVPMVTGMTRADAQALLEKEGFDVSEAEQTSNQPRGTVVATRPSAGSQTSVPSTVVLVLSAGAAAVEMPDLTGRDIDGARQMLVQLGVRDVRVTYDAMALGNTGTVLGQSPVAGATLSPGAPVELRVAGEGRP